MASGKSDLSHRLRRLLRLPRLSFRIHLTLWFALLACAILAGAGMYLGSRLTHDLAASRGETLYASARFTSDLLSTRINERVIEISLIADSSLLTEGDLSRPQVRRAFERRKVAHEEYAWIGVADVDGTVLQSADGLLIGAKVAERPWFVGAKRGFYIGDVHEAVLLAKLLPQKNKNEPLRFIDIAAPLFDHDGRLRGVLGSHVHWQWVTDTVEKLVRSHGVRGGMEVLIADRKGNILYPFDLIGRTRLPEMPDASARFATVAWEHGREYLTSVVGVEVGRDNALGWRIALRQPVELAFEPVTRLRDHLIGMGVLAALLCAVLVYRFAVRLSRPLEDLAEAVREVEAYGSTARYPTDSRIPEIRKLSKAVRSMTDSLLANERSLAVLNSSLEGQVAQRTAELTAANAELERLATRDSLTGLLNRRRFDEALREQFRLYRRNRAGFALAFVDVDHFKHVNDRFGHLAGDAVLRQLSGILGACTRETDLVGRYGGEEFVILLPGVEDAAAMQRIGEKIRAVVESTPFPEVGQLTISVGMSRAQFGDTEAQQIVARADRALYRAKGEGRNRVIID
ncbi:MAG: diguanylate cyclase [Candidatus Dactylopiibacterium sp.]|nr:diguanylate cyclase [Candidatus Dactylopiibacterium sp.]